MCVAECSFRVASLSGKLMRCCSWHSAVKYCQVTLLCIYMMLHNLQESFLFVKENTTSIQIYTSKILNVSVKCLNFKDLMRLNSISGKFSSKQNMTWRWKLLLGIQYEKLLTIHRYIEILLLWINTYKIPLPLGFVLGMLTENENIVNGEQLSSSLWFRAFTMLHLGAKYNGVF